MIKDQAQPEGDHLSGFSKTKQVEIARKLGAGKYQETLFFGKDRCCGQGRIEKKTVFDLQLG